MSTPTNTLFHSAELLTPVEKFTKGVQRNRSSSLVVSKKSDDFLIDINQNLKIQRKTFILWIQHNLSKSLNSFHSITKGFEDGVCLINLLENLSGKTMKATGKKPKSRNDKLENIRQALVFARKLGLNLTINPTDILEHKEPKILQMIWDIIMFFKMKQVPEGNYSYKDVIIGWCNLSLERYNIEISDISVGFLDGRAFCGIIDGHKSGLVEQVILEENQPKKTLTHAFELGKLFGIPAIIERGDLMRKKIDEKSILVYLAEFYSKFVTIDELKEIPQKIQEISKTKNQLSPRKLISPFSRLTNISNEQEPHKKMGKKLHQKLKKIEKQQEEKIVELYNELKLSQEEEKELRQEIENLKKPKKKTKDRSVRFDETSFIEVVEIMPVKEPIEKDPVIKQLEEELEFLKKEVDSKNQLLSDNRQYYSKQIIGLDRKYQEQIKQKEKINQKHDEESLQIKTKYQDQKKEIEEETKFLQKTVEELKQDLESKKNNQEANSLIQLQKIKSKKDGISKENQEIQEKVEKLKEQLGKMEETKNELQEKISQLEATKKQQLEKVEQERKDSQRKFDELEEEQEKVLETLGKTRDSTEKKQLQEEIQEKEEQIKKIREFIENKNTGNLDVIENMELNTMNPYVQELQEKHQKMEESIKEIEEFQTQTEKIQEMIEEQDSLLSKVIQENNEFKSQEEENVKRYKKESSKLQQENDQLKSQLQNQQEEFDHELDQKFEDIKKHSKLNLEKEENLKILEEELVEIRGKWSSQERILNLNIQNLNEEIEKEQSKSQNFYKINTTMSRELEETVSNYDAELALLKQVIEELKEFVQGKKKKSKKKDIFEGIIDLSAIKDQYEKQKTEIEQLHEDYDSLSKVLNVKINAISNVKKLAGESEEDFQKISTKYSEVEEKYANLKKEYENLKKQQRDLGMEFQEKEQLRLRIKQKEERVSKNQFETSRFHLREKFRTKYLGRLNTLQRHQSFSQDARSNTQNIDEKQDTTQKSSAVESKNAKQLTEKLIVSLSDTKAKITHLEKQKQKLSKDFESNKQKIDTSKELDKKIQEIARTNRSLIISIQEIESRLF
eukprot:Anaeramoba_ignava/c21831_g2_i1.p1 GENE.c21831_g2_i1~~c21831_g2_i1.p1  ORF type:complete len:1074 (-),score=431.60 c21831_g2_i1:15-3236(-)